MEVLVNGKRRTVRDGATVGDLLAELEMEPAVVNVQLNGKILERARFGATPLHPGDEVEILMFMGGGGW